MVQYSEEEGKLICSFSGRLDTADCLQWQEEMREKVAGWKGEVVFCMDGVDYVSSLFLRACVLVIREVGVGNLRLTHVSPAVKKVFKIAGMAGELKID